MPFLSNIERGAELPLNEKTVVDLMRGYIAEFREHVDKSEAKKAERKLLQMEMCVWLLGNHELLKRVHSIPYTWQGVEEKGLIIEHYFRKLIDDEEE